MRIRNPALAIMCMLILSACGHNPGYYTHLPPPKHGVLAFHVSSDPDAQRPTQIARRLLAMRPIPVERLWIFSSNYRDPKTDKQVFTVDDNAGAWRCGTGMPPAEGCIFVGMKLIQGLSDDALMGVLAHELGHLEKGHAPSDKVKRAVTVFQNAPSLCQSTPNAVATLALCGIGLATSVAAFGVAADAAGYSRDLEREADQSARERLVVSGYCAGPMMKAAFEELAKITRANSKADILSTHPGYEERISHANSDCGAVVREVRAVQPNDAKKDSELVAQYRAQAETGDPTVYVNLADMYAAGRGVTKDVKQAVFWYKKAAEGGDLGGQDKLGLMYRDGVGIIKDEEEAIRWFRKAAEAGHAGAQNNLGWMYGNGRGIAKDMKQAVYWYTKAAEQGEPYAQNNIGLMYLTGTVLAKNDKEAMRWFKSSAEAGNSTGQYHLGVMYRDGIGITKDDKEAVRWFTKSAEAGNVLGQTNLGVMYEKGMGVPKNNLQAVYWYAMAANIGYALAQSNLGVMYLKGDGVVRDDQEALRWLKRAADAGEPNGQYVLGAMYEDGRGVARDHQEAMRWYRKAAAAGHKAARSKIGIEDGSQVY